tara:strand:+ start:534 stop:1982 length:1449 start_codon:yes stop_codon:yes gene_type:complete
MKKINLNIKFNLKIGIFTTTSLFFLYLLYLSIPSLHDSGRVQKELHNKLIEEFGLNISLSSDIAYRILPQPHFHVKDSKIFLNKDKATNEIGEIKDIRIFINQRNLFKSENIEIKQIVLSKGNFFFNRQNLNFISKLFKNEFSKRKVYIKKSKLFFNDKNKSIIFIYTIENLNFFKNEKNNNQQFKTKGNIFNIPIKFSWEKNLNNKNIISNFKADKVDIEFINKSILLNGNYKYENILNILSNSFKTNYNISKNQIKLKSEKSLIINTPISYFGNIELIPFSFKIFADAEEIDLEYIFKNLFFINEIVSSNILLNDNINGLVKIKTSKLNKNRIFSVADININFEEGDLNFDNSYLENNKFAKITINNTKFESFEGSSNLTGEIKLNIFDHNQLYKLLPISKKKRFKRKFDKINFYFTLNLNSSKYSIDRINFLDNENQIIQSKNVDDFVEDNYETRFTYTNSVLLKNFMKKVLNTYLDDG